MTQGLLLYYMGTTLTEAAAGSLALKYLRNRSRRSRIELWPGPVARCYLSEVAFEAVLAAATAHSNLPDAVDMARTDLLSRRRLCGALFHDGVKRRAAGLEEECLERMRQCYSLEDPLIELEWYLARGEVERADRAAGAT